MTDHQVAVLGAAEGVGADIAWVVVYILCWFLMIAPFALWYAGVRTPRAERRARRAAATATDSAPDPVAVAATGDERTRVAG
jgi:hypothetical protein